MMQKLLSSAEISSLMTNLQGTPDSPNSAKADVKLYAVSNQEPIDKFNFPYIDIINQRFANFFNTSLAVFLRNSTEVISTQVKKEKYSDFIDRFNEYASINVFSLKPLSGNGLVILEASLVSALVDNLFGGKGHFQTADHQIREFTQTEQRIIRKFLNLVFEAQKKSWDLIRKVDFELTRSETKTQFARIASPHEMVITNTFYIKIGEVCSQMHLCIPVIAFNPIHDLLQNHVPNVLEGDLPNNWTESLKQQIKSADLELTANLATIQSTLRQLKELQPGDLLEFEMPEQIHLSVDGLAIMECSFGQAKGKYALKIEKLLKNSLQAIQDSSHEPN